MSDEKIELEYQGFEVKPVFGGRKIESTYVMTHTKYGRVNKYKVTCQLTGLQECNPSFSVSEVQIIGYPENTNDETLTSEGALDLFEDRFLS